MTLCTNCGRRPAKYKGPQGEPEVLCVDCVLEWVNDHFGQVPAPKPHEDDWKWWAGTNDEAYAIGPCETRQGAIDAMADDGSAEHEDDGVMFHVIHVVEATNPPLRVADWIDAGTLLERADENLMDSDRVGSENDDGPWFEVSAEQEADLRDRIRRACDEWQEAHGLVFTCRTFDKMRNRDVVTTDPVPLGGDGA